jgi:alpha-tubulin suppressor-like RCC1 family protein
LSSDGWLLMLALLISVWGAGAASAYDVAAGGSHTCVIDELGVVCWGFNYDGQSTVPGGLVSPTALAAGSSHTCAIDDNGVTCWGSDESGQSTVPAGLINPRAVAAGGSHTCAIDDNGVRRAEVTPAQSTITA